MDPKHVRGELSFDLTCKKTSKISTGNRIWPLAWCCHWD